MITDNTVDTRISFAANLASHPYCSARIAAVDPAGIPVIMIAIALINVGTFKNVNIIKTMKGYAIKRIEQKNKTFLSNRLFHSISARIDPTTNIEIAVVHDAILLIVLVINTGNLIPVSIMINPINTATTDGFLKTDFKACL